MVKDERPLQDNTKISLRLAWKNIIIKSEFEGQKALNSELFTLNSQLKLPERCPSPAKAGKFGLRSSWLKV
jgi:hypothetical protein